MFLKTLHPPHVHTPVQRVGSKTLVAGRLVSGGIRVSTPLLEVMPHTTRHQSCVPHRHNLHQLAHCHLAHHPELRGPRATPLAAYENFAQFSNQSWPLNRNCGAGSVSAHAGAVRFDRARLIARAQATVKGIRISPRLRGVICGLARAGEM